MGWFGKSSEIMHYLDVVGADRDEEGRFIISGAPVIVGLDPGEVVVPAETVYFKDGKPIPLAASMPDSRGVKVKVF